MLLTCLCCVDTYRTRVGCVCGDVVHPRAGMGTAHLASGVARCACGLSGLLRSPHTCLAWVVPQAVASPAVFGKRIQRGGVARALVASAESSWHCAFGPAHTRYRTVPLPAAPQRRGTGRRALAGSRDTPRTMPDADSGLTEFSPTVSSTGLAVRGARFIQRFPN